ncbi:MAG: DUF4347 domain-containing protein, partial [Marinomonas sp.]|uniref:DUF4347 domain-containing protein n=1 Tax=Marinomonas sp. TaxID=1904862 RepID=UPI003F9B5AFA
MKKQYSNKSGKKASGHYSLGNKKQARKPLITALEPRLLLDGAAVATAVDVLTDSQLHDASQIDNSHQGSDTSFVVAPTEVRAVDPSLNNGKKEVVFIEDNVADYQSLIDGANTGVEVVLLDSTQDGLAQMAEWAKTHSDYDAIHVISHGAEGQVNLGGFSLDNITVKTRSADLAQLGAALNEEGDLLLYGCSVASGEGQDFITALAQATQADVAASNDITGAAGKGGDWVLEKSIGQIDVAALQDVNYQGTLANVTFGFESGVSGVGSKTVTQTKDGETLTVVATENFGDSTQTTTSVDGSNSISTYTGSQITSQLEFTISGKVFDFTSIKIYNANADATFTFTPNDGAAFTTSTISSGQTVTIDLSSAGFQGVSNITMTSSDSLGVVVDFDSVVLTNITAASALPNAPSTPDLSAASDTGISSTDNVTKDNTPTFTGTAEAGATVTLFDTDGTTSLGTATADGAGNWSITSSALSDGSHIVTTKATDAAGNVSSTSSGLTLTIDATNPVISTTGGSLTYMENDAATVIDGGATLTEVGSPGSSVLTVQISANAEATDTLSLATGISTGINVNGTDLRSGSTNIGTVTASSVTNNTIWTLTFLSSATAADIQGVLQAIRYNSTSDNPSASARTVTFNLTDGAGNQGSNIRDIAVTAVNDAPVLSDQYGTFGEAIGSGTDRAYEVAVQSDGKAVVVGYSWTGTSDDIALLRYNTDGSLDSSFGDNGVVLTSFSSLGAATNTESSVESGDDRAYAIAIDANGKIVVAGQTKNDVNENESIVVRYNSDGSVDTSFGNNGFFTYDEPSSAYFWKVQLTSDGGYLFGYSSDSTLVKLDASGNLDANWGVNGVLKNATYPNATSGGFKVASDGSVYQTLNDTVNKKLVVVKYSVDGVADTDFGTAGFAIITPNYSGTLFTFTVSISGASDNALFAMVSTQYLDGSFVQNSELLKVDLTTASLDSSFGTNGFINLSGLGFSQYKEIIIDANSKINLIGNNANGGGADYQLMRFNADGSLDTTFGTSGKVTTDLDGRKNYAWGADIDADGYIFIAGNRYQANGNNDFVLAKYSSSGSLDSDFKPPVNYTEGGTAAVVASDLVLSDIDSTTLATATIAISTHFTTGDLLTFINDGSSMGNISASYDSINGTLTLTSASASANLAEWQSALRAVTYSSTSDVPTLISTSRSVTFVVNDGIDQSNIVTKTLLLTPVNDTPTISNAPADITVTEDTASNVDLSGVTFVDSDGDNLTVTLTTSAGTLAASSGGNVTVSNSGTGTLTLSGTAANINTYLDTTTNIQYIGASNTSGDNAATISIKANDGTTDSTISTVNINITEVNDEPTLTATPLNPTFTEGGADVTLFNNPNASTVEAGQTIEQLTLTVSNISDLGNEFLTFGSVNIALQDNQSASHTSPAVFSYTVSLTGTTATVTINASDTAAVWQNYVPFLKYKNTSEAPTEGNRVVTLTSITDSGSNTGANDNVADLSIASTVAVVQVPAVVASVAATTSNGSYNEGDVIAITVTFDDAVTVTGTPQLILETGSEDRVVDYVSGSGSNTLTFNYTVQAGDTSADLDYISTSALTLNGGSIKDAGGYDATLTLATPGASDSLGANKAIVIDTTAPSSPTTPDMTAGTDSGTSSTDDITNDTTPTVTGTAEAGATVVLYDTDGTTSLGSATADGSGNWSITSSELSTGSHTLTTKATDTAGNVSVASSGLTITVDDTAPTLSSSNPADGAVSVAPSGDITLTFSEDIAKGYDEITLINVTTGTTVETFDVLNGGNLTYSGNTVTLNPVSDLDEATTYAIRIDGNAVRDTAGNTYAGISDNTTLNFTTGVTDSTAPTFLSIQRADDDVVNSDTTSFTLTFNEAVTAVAGDFELNVGGSVAGTIGSITGSGTNTITVNVTGISGVGTLGLNLKSDHAVTDAAGNALATAEPADDEVYTVDTVAPTLISINRVDSATTNADSVQFIAVFSETVTGLGIDDFELTGTATNGANISSVTGTGNGFVITISGVDGDGTLGVQLKSAATVNDIAGNALTATTPSALLETYTIENTAPTATAIITTNTALSTADSVTFDVTFSEAVTNVSMDDFEISGDVTGAISAVSGSGSSYTVTVSNIVGDGALGLNFNSGQNITDIAGNALAGTELATDESYTIDNTLPTVTSISRGMVNQVEANTATDVVFTVVMSETVTGIETSDFAVTGNASNTGVSNVSSSDGKVFKVTVSGVNGTIGQTVGLSFTGSADDALSQASTAQFTSGDNYTIAGTLLNEGALTQAQLDAIVDLNREGTLLEQSVADAKQVIIIDSRVPGLVELTKQANPEADIWLLDGSRSATEQITEILANYSDLDALHILSHGGVGEIYLGAETVSADAITQNSATYAAWGKALSDSGDILLYGCNVAQGDTGMAFINQFAQVTGADIAASDDLTGSAVLGGDWVLEASTASIESNNISVSDYSGVLASQFSQTADPLAAAGAVSGDQSWLYTVAIDYDSDGDQDFLAYDGSAYSFFNNDGSGSFTKVTPNTSFPLQKSEAFLVADFDNDGDEDVIVADGTGLPSYYRNNGDSTFTLSQDPLASAGAVTGSDNWLYTVAIDYDSDGDQDFLAYDGSAYSFFNNDGSGSFTKVTPNTSFPLQNSEAFLVADFDNDGDEDVIAADGTGLPSYYLNNGDSTFTLSQDPLASAGAVTGSDNWLYTVAIDYDSDGDQDFLAYDGAAYSFFDNDGSGSFTKVTPNTSFPLQNSEAFLVADFDHDGDEDVIVADGAGVPSYYRQDGTVAGTDNKPPVIDSATPTNNATGIEPTANITLTFDEIISSTGTGAIKIYKTSDNSLVESIPGNDGRVTGSGSSTITINPTTDLDASTEYYIQIDKQAFFDADGMTFVGIVDKTTLSFTTGAGVDTAAPSFETSTPSALNISTTTLDLTADIDEAGTIYYVVVPDGATAPTAAEVKAGTASGGGAAITSGNAAVSTGAFSNTFSVSGLSANTAYDIYVVAEDDEGTPNLQGTPARVDVSTIAPPNAAPTISGAPASITTTEDTASNIDLSAVTFADGDDDSLTVTLSVNNGTFSTPADGSGVGAGVTEALVNATTITLVGSATDINTYLDTASNIRYTGAANAAGTNAATLTISASDGTANLASNPTVNINITNVNDAPTVANAPATISVTEDTASNLDLSSVVFADVDNDNLTVTLSIDKGSFSSPADGSGFGSGVTETLVDSKTITLSGSATDINTYLDTASNIQYTGANNVSGNGAATLTISANDANSASLASNSTVSINITEVNDAPTISGASANQAVNDSATLTPFSNVVLADVDSANVSMTVALDTAAKGTFTAASLIASGFTDAGSGSYTLTSTTLASAQAALRALVFDPADNRVAVGLTESTTFTITVNDGTTNGIDSTTTVVSTSINDAPTDIVLSDTTYGHSEGATNVVVGSFSATDADTGESFTYSLVSGVNDTDNAKFNIDGANLRVTDRANVPAGTYSIRVQVNDGDATFEKSFSITVSDDIAPTISAVVPADNATGVSVADSIEITFDEGVQLGNAGTITLYDITGNGANSLTIDVGNHNGQLAIVGNKLTINPTNNLMATNQYAIQITAGALTDSSDNALAAISDTISYNFTTGTVDTTAPTVAIVDIADPTQPNAGTVTINFSEQVTNVDIADFALTRNGDTVDISGLSVTGSGHAYTIDLSSVTTSEGTYVLTLNKSNITDASGNALADGDSDTFVIDTTAPTGVAIVRAGADTQSGSAATFTAVFSEAVSGVDAADFVLTGTAAGGSITSVTQVSDSVYTITVNGVSSDGTLGVNLKDSGTGITDTAGNAIGAGVTGQQITIDNTGPSVVAINRDGAVLTTADSATYTVTFNEAVTGVDVSDFSLSGGATGTVASITGSGRTYQVTVNNISGDGSLRLDLNASGTGITDTVSNAIGAGFTSGDTLTIDNTTPVVTASQAFNLDEGMVADTVIGQVKATDTNGVSQFSIQSGNDNGYFAIDNNGVVTLTSAGAAAIDYETATSYTLNIMATDAVGQASTAAAVTISINDINDNAPVFSSAATATLAENTAVTTVVYDANATDADGTSVHNSVTYSLKVTDDHNVFTIDSTTGEVKLKAAADYETKSSYNFTVIASDGMRSTEQDVTLSITDVNDNTPAMTSGATGSVNENADTSTVIYTATATDADGTAANSTLVYSLSGDDADKLIIDATTGEVTLKASADYETQTSYSFNVVATDNGAGNFNSGSLSTTQAVIVSVNDLNDNTPVMTSGATGSVNENADTSTVIYTATATDADGTAANSTLVYSLSGDDAD